MPLDRLERSREGRRLIKLILVELVVVSDTRKVLQINFCLEVLLILQLLSLIDVVLEPYFVDKIALVPLEFYIYRLQVLGYITSKNYRLLGLNVILLLLF